MKKFFLSFAFAWNGIKTAFSEQQNVRFHFVATVVTVAAGIYFDITAGEWLALILIIALVIVTELINTAIEGLVDLVSPQRNPLAGKIKDIAAGAVLISALAAIVTGTIIFAKYIVN
jgi:diacylglycerol kinase (ATP)